MALCVAASGVVVEKCYGLCRTAGRSDIGSKRSRARQDGSEQLCHVHLRTVGASVGSTLLVLLPVQDLEFLQYFIQPFDSCPLFPFKMF
jgi:hypothetical protein